MDISDAFKQLGIRKDQHHLYCIKWRKVYYYYVRLCFGSRSSPKIFDNLSVAICWIAKNNYNIPVILHLLDDFFTIQTADTSGDRNMAILTMIFKTEYTAIYTEDRGPRYRVFRSYIRHC